MFSILRNKYLRAALQQSALPCLHGRFSLMFDLMPDHELYHALNTLVVKNITQKRYMNMPHVQWKTHILTIPCFLLFISAIVVMKYRHFVCNITHYITTKTGPKNSSSLPKHDNSYQKRPPNLQNVVWKPNTQNESRTSYF